MATCQSPTSTKDSATSLTDVRPKGARHRPQKSLASLGVPQQTSNLLESTKEGPLSIDRLCDFLIDILGALRPLHASSVAHGLIRPDTLYQDSQGTFHLPPLPEEWCKEEVRQEAGTQSKTKTLAGDIFAVGFCLQYLATGLFPLEDALQSNRLLVAEQPLPSSLPHAIQEVLQNMLSKPDERWSAETCYMKAVATSFAQAKPTHKIIRNDTANVLQWAGKDPSSQEQHSVFSNEEVQQMMARSESEAAPTYPHNLTTPFSAETIQEQPLMQPRGSESKVIALSIKTSTAAASTDIPKEPSIVRHPSMPSRAVSAAPSDVFLAAISGLSHHESKAYLAELQQQVAAGVLTGEAAKEQEVTPESGALPSNSTITIGSSMCQFEMSLSPSKPCGDIPVSAGLMMQRSMALNLDDLGI